ncbi:43274_t:CDS:2, partial [Gigaspora margarita]
FLAPSSTIIGVVNTLRNFSCQKGKYASKQALGKIQKITNDFKSDFPIFLVSVGDFVLQKISESIIENWETKCKNKIKKARNHGISLPPKRKNAIPPTSRFKKKTAQSLEAHSNIGKTDDEIDDRSNKNDSPTRHNSNNIPFAIKSLSYPSISTRLLATGSNIGSSEVNDDSNISELSTITHYVMKSSGSLKNPSSIISKKSLRPSRTSGRLSETSSNRHEVGGSISTQSFDQPLSLIDKMEIIQ